MAKTINYMFEVVLSDDGQVDEIRINDQEHRKVTYGGILQVADIEKIARVQASNFASYVKERLEQNAEQLSIGANVVDE